jgi:hypothetical protein
MYVFISQFIASFMLYNMINYVYRKNIYNINYLKYKLNKLLADIYNYFYPIKNENINENNKIIEVKEIKPKFEDKYLEKFKKMKNEFYLSESELEDIEKETAKLKDIFYKEKYETVDLLFKKVFEIDDILQLFEHVETNKETIQNILLKYFDLDEDDDEVDDKFLEEYREKLCCDKQKFNSEIEEENSKIIDEEQIKTKARENIINNKLDKFINNYVSEYTPLGNIFMRYNNYKKSFEYFSNNTIPYRYLEPVARKYAVTYWCKPIVYDADEHMKEIDAKSTTPNIKRSHDFTKQPMKNRNTPEIFIPTNKNKNNEEKHDKIIIKENANRYTWEGRIADFKPIQKIDKKTFNKKSEMTYADFKRLKNKK